jgi:hypothetical protein
MMIHGNVEGWMVMHWVIQDNFLSGKPGWGEFLETLSRFGIDHSFHRVTPRTGELVPEAVLDHGNVYCCGSYSMRNEALRRGWKPGVFDLFEQDFQRQRDCWGAEMLNYNSVVCSLSAAECAGKSVFVRPVADSKSFTGKLFAKAEFDLWKAGVCGGMDEASSGGSSLTGRTQVQVGAPIEIHAEYRLWIVKGLVATSSVYRRGGQAFFSDEVDDRVVAYAQDRVAEWQPHEAFVLDVCDTPAGMRVVEINTINCSAFYAADVQRLVGALEDAFSE